MPDVLQLHKPISQNCLIPTAADRPELLLLVDVPGALPVVGDERKAGRELPWLLRRILSSAATVPLPVIYPAHFTMDGEGAWPGLTASPRHRQL